MVVAAGDWMPGAILRSENKLNTDGTILKGQVLTLNTGTGNWQLAAAAGNVKGPFCIAALTPQTTDSTVSVIREGFVYLKSGGTILPNSYVQCDSSVAGQVIAFVATVVPTTPGSTDVVNAAGDPERKIGLYEGHENENSLNNPASNAASGDIIRVKLGLAPT